LEIPWSVIAGSFVFRVADYCSPAVAAGLASGNPGQNGIE
jgi:hypothetical protein